MGGFDTGFVGSMFSAAPIDWFIIAAIAAVFAFDSLRSGNARATAVALAASTSLFVWLPLVESRFVSSIVALFESSRMQALLFGALFLFMCYTMNRLLGSPIGPRSPLPALLSGLAVAALIVVMWQYVPALQSVWDIDTRIESIFSGAYTFWWIVIAYIALAYARA